MTRYSRYDASASAVEVERRGEQGVHTHHNLGELGRQFEPSARSVPSTIGRATSAPAARRRAAEAVGSVGEEEAACRIT